MRAALFCLVFLPLLATAETAYVTDRLQLGLHLAADTSDRAFRTVESGQEMEIISRDRNYASVRLPDGAQGYVKAAYLVFEKPAKLIVSELQAAHQKLQEDMETARAEYAAPADSIAALKRQIAEQDEALVSSASRIAALTTEVEDFRHQFGEYKYSLPLTWVGGAMFVCLLGGFLSGLWWIDYRSRRRHGGIRIF